MEYGYKIIEAFRDGTFLSEHFKKSDDAVYDYVLKDVNSFIQKIELNFRKYWFKFVQGFFKIIITSWFCKNAY